MRDHDQVLAAGNLGRAARWGARRSPSVQIRVDEDAAEALATVPERDRRRVASEAIRRAVKEYRDGARA